VDLKVDDCSSWNAWAPHVPVQLGAKVHRVGEPVSMRSPMSCLGVLVSQYLAHH